MVARATPSLDRMFQALAHPARRAMLRRLSEGEQNLTELGAPFKMSFPAVSKHVQVLERACLVQRRVVGRTHICRIHAAPLQEVAQWTEGYRRYWDDKFTVLDGYLNDLQKKDSQDDHGK